jgi:hypothetical protein
MNEKILTYYLFTEREREREREGERDREYIPTTLFMLSENWTRTFLTLP